MKKVAKSHRAVPAKPPKTGGSTKPFFQKKGNSTYAEFLPRKCLFV